MLFAWYFAFAICDSIVIMIFPIFLFTVVAANAMVSMMLKTMMLVL